MRRAAVVLGWIVLWASGAAGCGAPQRRTESSQKRVDLGRDLLARQEYGAAETELKKALDLDPKNEEALNWLGIVYLVRAERTVALVEDDDCRSDSLGEQIRREADDWMRQAKTYFKEATGLAPDFGEAWQNRAVVSMYFKDWNEAIEYEQNALARLGRLQNESVARANLGWCYYHKGDLVRAERELLQAMQGEPTFCLGAYRLAQVLFDQSEYDDALARLELFAADAKICPLQEVQYLMAQLYLRKHQSGEARGALERCISMAPKSCVAQRCQATPKGVP